MGGSREGLYEVLHREAYLKHSQNQSKSEPKFGRNQWKYLEIRPGRLLVMVASQQPHGTGRVLGEQSRSGKGLVWLEWQIRD